jgi:hypothetical protein
MDSVRTDKKIAESLSVLEWPLLAAKLPFMRQVATTKLAVDRQMNVARSRARPSMELRPDRPDVRGS